MAGIVIHKCEYRLGIYFILRFCPLNPPSGAAAQLPRAFPSQADHGIWLRSLRWWQIQYHIVSAPTNKHPGRCKTWSLHHSETLQFQEMKLGNNSLQTLMLHSVFCNNILVKNAILPLYSIWKWKSTKRWLPIGSYYHINIINRKFVQYVLQVSSGKLMCMLK